MKFIVAQIGARRGYAVPAILEKAGMLERFYTDVCGSVGWGRLLAAGRHLPIVGTKLNRLWNRALPPEIRSRTRTFAIPNLRWLARTTLSNGNPTERFRLEMMRQNEIGRVSVRLGFGKATHLYSMLTEFPPLIVAAKEHGLTVVSEVYTLISLERIIAAERQRFPDWEPNPPDFDLLRRQLGLQDILFRYVDWYVCPSEAVRDDLVANWGVKRERTTVLPYGVGAQWFQCKSNPCRGRILFVGTAGLGKGIHYLAMAAKALTDRRRCYEFRIAGDVQPRVTCQPVCRYLDFLGRVPRDRIAEEYAAADVFVLPTLAEGSAGAVYEALAAGVPVITTPAAGSVVRDGVEGRIVPERDSDALARAIEEVVEDRVRRERMARAARERAKDFTWEKYGERLVAMLKSLS